MSISTPTNKATLPTLIYGTGFLGTPSTFPTADSTLTLLQFLKSHGVTHLDSARRYPALIPGLAESLLGSAGAAEAGFTIDSKIKISPVDGAEESLIPAKIAASVEESYTALQLDQPRGKVIDTLYPHAPDPVTPIAETARGFDVMFRAGRFLHLGLSNYSAVQIEEWMLACEERGYVRPSVYQGQYNPLCRRLEEDGLLECLRKYGMRLNAFSPLAGGFLSGKASKGEREGTRFEGENKMGGMARGLYDRPVMHAAVRKLQAVIEPLGMEMTECVMRWLMHHSVLGEGDGVIVGGSKLETIGRNVVDAGKGPLPGVVVRAVEEMWVMVRDEAP